jgi:thiol:disulfide interchange protein DsbC
MKQFAVTASMGLLALAVVSTLPASQQTPASSANTSTASSVEPLQAPVPPVAPVAPAAAQSAPAPALAPVPVPPAVSAEILRSVAALAGEGVKAEDIRSTPIPGMFEMRRGTDILYVSQDGRYVFTGDLYRVAGRQNLTEARRSELRRALIDAVPESKMVVFAPAQPKYTITVFTDVDCPYCQALHSQIAEYNRLGVKVRYLFFPRSGPNTESWHKAEQIWCSSDRKAALTAAKLGKPLQAKVCSNTPVAQGYELGKQIGLEGTPGIVLANGTMLGGYMPPDKLVEELKQQSP